MNRNIFSPKGTINQSFFILYYIFLLVLYIVGGVYLLIGVVKYHVNPWYFIWVLLIIKILLLFNYKKRLLDISGNFPLSIVLSILLTFDNESLVLCQHIKDSQVSMITFFIMCLFFVFVQPAIVALLPTKNCKE